MDLNTVQPESESETGGSISEFNSQTALSSKSLKLFCLSKSSRLSDTFDTNSLLDCG
jgi:hypothetical protein